MYTLRSLKMGWGVLKISAFAFRSFQKQIVKNADSSEIPNIDSGKTNYYYEQRF